MKRAMRIISAAGIMGMLAAACGDDRPSSEELSAKVTEICKATGQRHEEAMAAFDFSTFDPDTSDLTEILPLMEQNFAIGHEAAAALKKVRGPKADEDQIALWIEIEQKIWDNGVEITNAANSGDRELFKSLAAVEEGLMAEFEPDAPMFEGC